MAIRDVPSTGLVLKHTEQKKDTDGPQIIRLDLLQSKTRELLQQLKEGQKVSLQTGKQAAVHYGKEKLALDASSEPFPAEIYTRSHNKDAEIYFSGKLSLHLEMVKAREDTAKADAALANLQSTLSSLREEQLHNETTMMGTKAGKHGQLKPMQSRKDQLLGSTLSRPSSPFLGSAFSPATGPTSMPGLGGSNPKDKIRTEAMKVPVIHLLASKPMSVKAVADKIRAPRQDCERLLEKVARDSAGSEKKELKDKSYRELDVWKFPYTNDADREAAIEHAIHAFDRMRIEKTDNLWQMLLKPEDRGKGKTLSRLNFDKPVHPPKTAAAPIKKTDVSDPETTTTPAKKSTTIQRAAEKKGHLKEPAVKSRAVSPAPPKKREPPPKSASSETKFKSAERIEDSDEEASSIEVAAPKPIMRKKEKEINGAGASSRDRNESPVPKKSAHKPSTSSSSSASDNPDAPKSKSSLKAPTKETSIATSKKSPRPRHGSSPQKPSPLGSSPPANSTDFDSSSSTTTKGTSQSSAPSSPPSESDMPLSKHKQKYSPIVSERARDASSSRVMKRKQGDGADGPPAKRQQINGVHSKVAESVTTKVNDRPHLARKVSESERSSSPEKPAHIRDEVMDKAKRFQLYYKRYKILHDKISSTPETNRDSKDMDSLWVMHKRLRDMKTEIWQDWDSVEPIS